MGCSLCSPNTKCIEIAITTSCSLACFNCDRSVRQVPSDEAVSLEQIHKFIDESIKFNWRWSRIRIMGGESTLHPQLFKILKIIKQIRTIVPQCIIEVLSNGYGKNGRKVLSKLPDWVYIVNSHKTSKINRFSSYNIAPIDLDDYQNTNFSKGCWVPHISGLGLTRYGHYPCGAGASIDRVFGFNIGLKNLSSVTYSTLRRQLKILCKYCGHYKTNYIDQTICEEQMSAS